MFKKKKKKILSNLHSPLSLIKKKLSYIYYLIILKSNALLVFFFSFFFSFQINYIMFYIHSPLRSKTFNNKSNNIYLYILELNNGLIMSFPVSYGL
jgi:hypothetical protein